MRKNSKSVRGRSRLISRVERELVPSHVDSLDPDVLSYVSTFLDELSSTPPLEHLDLSTIEGAQAALDSINQRQADLFARRRNLALLRQLLLERQGTE